MTNDGYSAGAREAYYDWKESLGRNPTEFEIFRQGWLHGRRGRWTMDDMDEIETRIQENETQDK